MYFARRPAWYPSARSGSLGFVMVGIHPAGARMASPPDPVLGWGPWAMVQRYCRATCRICFIVLGLVLVSWNATIAPPAAGLISSEKWRDLYVSCISVLQFISFRDVMLMRRKCAKSRFGPGCCASPMRVPRDGSVHGICPRVLGTRRAACVVVLQGL